MTKQQVKRSVRNWRGEKQSMTIYETSKEVLCRTWQENLKNFCQEHEFPAEARESLHRDLQKVCENSRLFELFRSYEEAYWKNPELDYAALWKDLETAGEEEQISGYTLDLLFAIGISRRTWELYEEKGISRQIFHDSMADLHWKLLECHKMYGIWGTFVAFWFPWWFELKRFALGRLQFELIPFEHEYEKDGIAFHKDTTVINVHIPSCGPLDPETCKASYAQAAEFFGDQFRDRPLVFVCESWLLYPPHREILPEHSNIRKFMADYDVFETVEDNGDLWRIFYGAEKDGFENLPENTGLERGYKKWLLEGHKAGYGWGVYVYRI